MKMNSKKGFTRTPKFGVTPKGGGFTLIELLLVVSIVGILIAITMNYLGGARAKGSDASVQSNLATVRALSEIFYLDNFNSYLPVGGSVFGPAPCPVYDIAGTNMFSKNKSISMAITEAVLRGKGSSCYNSGTNWAIAVGLNLNLNTSWCVDNEGSAKVENSAPDAAINGATFRCN